MAAGSTSLKYLPKEWHDDAMMDVMFSPFRENRDVNPASWDKKMQFWKDVIYNVCVFEHKPGFDAQCLPQKFQRNGKVPVCLDMVLHNMIRQGKLQLLADYKASVEAGWVSWGLGIFVQKPVSWAWGKVFKSSGANPVQGYLLHLDVLKDIAEQVHKQYLKQVKNDLTDRTIDIAHLWEHVKDICCDMESLNLALMQLCKDKKAAVLNTDKNEIVVRFANANKRSVTPVSDIELRILRARRVEEHLDAQIKQLAEDMERCRIDAKFYLQQGLKSAAKNALRRKKTMEKLLEKREAALDTIRHMLTQIQDAHSNKMIIDAYSECSRAFKDTAKSFGLTTDNIDDVMTDVQEVFDMNEEINASLAQGPSDPILDLSSSELEKELDDLLAGGELPSTPQDDILSELGKLSISTRDNLPDVPEFDPACVPTGFSPSKPAGERLASFTHSPRSAFHAPQPGQSKKTEPQLEPA